MNIDESLWTWKDLIEGQFSKSTSTNEKQIELTQRTKEILFKTIEQFEHLPFDDKSTIEITFQSKILMTITLMKNALKNERCSIEDLNPLVEFYLLWSFYPHLQSKSFDQFQLWIRQHFVHLPKQRPITDWMYDIDSHQFILWSDTIPAFNPIAHQGIPAQIFVHTPYTMVIVDETPPEQHRTFFFFFSRFRPFLN